jgi:hypothetical protein
MKNPAGRGASQSGLQALPPADLSNIRQHSTGQAKATLQQTLPSCRSWRAASRFDGLNEPLTLLPIPSTNLLSPGTALDAAPPKP